MGTLGFGKLVLYLGTFVFHLVMGRVPVSSHETSILGEKHGEKINIKKLPKRCSTILYSHIHPGFLDLLLHHPVLNSKIVEGIVTHAGIIVMASRVVSQSLLSSHCLYQPINIS